MLKAILLTLFLSYGQTDTTDFKSPRMIIDDAEALIEQDQLAEAIASYQLILPNDTAFIEAQVGLMSALNQAGQYEESRKIGFWLKDSLTVFRLDVYIRLGNAFFSDDKIEEAKGVYEEGLTFFPYSHILLYNLGLVHEKKARYADAIACFQKSASINPFYSNNHMMLGYLEMLQGHRATALLSYMTFLAISPGSNSILVFLENLSGNKVRTEGSIEEVHPYDVFEYEESLLRSMVAFDERFIRQVDFNASIVKQSELLLSKLDYKQGTGDFWMEFYVPFFQEVYEQGYADNFIYYMLSSVKNEDVDKWLENHAKEQSAWVGIANAHLKEFRSSHEAVVVSKRDTYSFWYFDSHELSAIGNQTADDVRQGPWEFYSYNGQLNAKGSYNAGSPIGEWLYYHDNGMLSRRELYDESGAVMEPAKYYHEDGTLSIVAHYKGNQLNGFVEFYYECGQVKEKYPYVEGVGQGAGQLIHPNGVIRGDYILKENELDGLYTFYYQNGVVSERTNYSAGLLEGEHISYYLNGQINEKGNYKEGELEGHWVGFYNNGAKSFEGDYLKGNKVGEWTYYHNNGKVRQTESMDEEGNVQGKIYNYDYMGRLYQISEHQDGVAIGYKIIDIKNDTLFAQRAVSGEMISKQFYKTGELKSEGTIKNGKLNGPYKEYFKSGAVRVESVMKDGSYEGFTKEFFSHGGIKYQCNFSDGDANGYYKSYYDNGQLEQEGWYVYGSPEQLWKFYSIGGGLDEIRYYITGEQYGWNEIYGPGDRLSEREFFMNGTLTRKQQYDSLGNMYHDLRLPQGSGAHVEFSVAGDTLYKGDLLCSGLNSYQYEYFPGRKIRGITPMKNGLFEGDFVAYWPNGKIRTKGSYAFNEAHGEWSWYNEDGVMTSRVQYILGAKNGLDEDFYTNGQMEVVCDRIDGDRSGACRYYDHDGNLILIKLYDKEEGLIAHVDPFTGDTIPFVSKGDYVIKTNFADGKPAAIQTFKDGYFQGETRYYSKSSGLMEEMLFVNGNYHGVYKRYYPNGKLERETNYFHDTKHGLETAYYESGKVKRKTYYLNDEKNGHEIMYGSGGKVSSKIFYRNGDVY